MWSSDTELLHIVPQHMYHDPAFIAGNRLGLTRLRDAIDAALAAPGKTAQASVMPIDGEGYNVFVRCETERFMELVPYGYTDEVARQTGAGWARMREAR
jgi:hypothetical protein